MAHSRSSTLNVDIISSNPMRPFQCSPPTYDWGFHNTMPRSIHQTHNLSMSYRRPVVDTKSSCSKASGAAAHQHQQARRRASSTIGYRAPTHIDTTQRIAPHPCSSNTSRRRQPCVPLRQWACCCSWRRPWCVRSSTDGWLDDRVRESRNPRLSRQSISHAHKQTKAFLLPPTPSPSQSSAATRHHHRRATPAPPAALQAIPFFSSSNAGKEEQEHPPPLWVMAPAVGVARRLGGELVEMGLAR